MFRADGRIGRFAPWVVLAVLGCSSSDDGADGDAPPGSGGATSEADTPRGTGPGDWSAGDYPPGLMDPTFLELADVEGQQGHVREFKVHVPPSYDPEVPTPVVFCLHGLQQNAVMFCVNGADMIEKSDEAGFILVMPNGFSNYWNGGSCCTGEVVLEDVAFIRALFEEVGTHVNVDLDRVYATGLSNGGIMSYRLACDAADIFAAVAPGSGALTTTELGWGIPDGDLTECAPSEPVSLLDIHGTADEFVPYPAQALSLEMYSAAVGCGTATTAATEPASAGDTTCVTYTGCPDSVELTACTVEGGGHVWFGNDSCGTGAGEIGCSFVGQDSDTLVNTDVIWDFLSRHSK